MVFNISIANKHQKTIFSIFVLNKILFIEKRLNFCRLILLMTRLNNNIIENKSTVKTKKLDIWFQQCYYFIMEVKHGEKII